MTPPHDYTVPYVETDLGTVTAAFTEQLSADGRSAVVSGNCPQCHGSTSHTYPRGMPGGGTKGGNQGSLLAQEPQFCQCGYVHDSQPANVVFLGCGAMWRVAGGTP